MMWIIVLLSCVTIVSSNLYEELRQFPNDMVNSHVKNVSKRWQNSFDKQHKFTAPLGHAVYSIESRHDSKYEDRVWTWLSRPEIALEDRNTCIWSIYQNDWDKPVNYVCPNFSPILGGTESYHSNKREDRRFKYECCGLNPQGFDIPLFYCYWTGWTAHDAYFKQTASTGWVFTGVQSQHSGKTEDRQFKFRLCKTTP